jgi:hypothetical protein
MYQTYVDHDTYEWQNSYAYSSIVGEFLHLPVSIIFLSISGSEIDGYKVPSTYTTYTCFTQVYWLWTKTMTKPYIGTFVLLSRIS